jgi:hypothetical protein
VATTEIYAGAEQADVAVTTVNGVTYRCFVWLAAGGLRVEAKIFAEGEDGQLVLIDEAVVADARETAVDCPRVLSVADSLFVVHWIDYEMPADAIVGAELYRSIFDMTDIAAGWINGGAVALHTTCQYDHAAIPLGIIVTRRTAADTILTVRYRANYGWIDTDWTATSAGLTIADTVLACVANTTDNVVLFSYQDTLLLRTVRLNATDGLGSATAETFSNLLNGDMRFAAVGYTRITTGATPTYLVVVEAIPDAEFGVGDVYTRLVGWRLVLASSAVALHESQWCKNVHMLSRPWTWASGVSGALEAFVALSFKSIADDQEFDQMYGYVVRLDVAALNDANAAGVIRPIPVSAIMSGTVDARPHGKGPTGAATISIGCRLNHLSHVSGPPQYTLGPDLKSVLFAITRWSRLKASQDADSTVHVQPVEAGVGYIRFYHADPWMLPRDASEPTQPDTPAWRGSTRTLAKPVSTPAGLIWAGGLTSCYDGQQVVELGYLWVPELSVVLSESGDIGDAGTYYWYVNTVWTDAHGQMHRGPPSRPVSVALAATQTAILTIRCLNLSMKDDRRRYPTASRIYFEIWRTVVVGGGMVTETENGVASYLFRSEFGGPTFELQDLPANDHEEFSITQTVGHPNNVAQNNELAPYQLDTTSLQWVPPPPIPHQPLHVACTWQNRLFGVDPEQGLLRWSEEILPIGTQLAWPEFLDTNVFRLGAIGDVTALVPLDSMLVIFTRDGTYAISGDPGAGGSGSDMSLQHIAKDIGCLDARTVAAYSEGIFFQSSKGIHRLTRGQGIDYPGAPIEDLVRAAGICRSAVHLENRHQIRYTLQAAPGTGPLVVRPRIATYDYRVGQWSVRTIPPLAAASTANRLNEMQHACSWRGRQGEVLHVVLQQGGLAIERASTDTVYADVGASTTDPICMDVTTEWIHPAGIVGQWLCDEIGIQTERVHAGPLTIHIWYNVDGRFDGTYNTAVPHCVWTYASAPAYIPLRPNVFKFSWFKLRIFEPASAPSTENVRLVSLTVDWRALPKLRRVARL